MSAADDLQWPPVERHLPKDSMLEVLDSINDRLAAIERRFAAIERRLDQMNSRLDDLSSAFVVNDLGRPDFDGHRKAHLDMLRAAAQLDSYKSDGAKKVIGVVVLTLAAIFALGIIEWIKGAVR